MLTQLLVPAVFALGCCSKPLEARADEFTLYAYGEGIGGVGVGYKDDLAYVSGGSDSSVQAVTFQADTGSGQPTQLAATVDGVDGSHLFYVPSTSGAVGFTDGPGDDKITDFEFYGPTLLVVNADGEFEGLFHATPTDTDQLWAVNYGPAGEGDITLTLRTVGPA